MKWTGLLSTLLAVPAVTAAPALVWQKANGAAAALPLHTSEDIGESGLFRAADDESSLQRRDPCLLAVLADGVDDATKQRHVLGAWCGLMNVRTQGKGN